MLRCEWVLRGIKTLWESWDVGMEVTQEDENTVNTTKQSLVEENPRN